MRRIRRWRDKTIQVGSKWIQEILPLLHHRTQLHCCSLRAQQGIRVSLPSSLNEACFAAEICSLPSCPSQFKNQDSPTKGGQAAGVIFRTVANPSWASGVLIRMLLNTYGLGSCVQGKGALYADNARHRRRTGGSCDCAWGNSIRRGRAMALKSQSIGCWIARPDPLGLLALLAVLQCL